VVEMKEVKIYTEYVTLGQFLKIADIIQTGGEAKFFLSENVVYVNDEEDNRRGRKLRNGDVVLVGKEKYQIVNEG
jgi:ribosome-associated protein